MGCADHQRQTASVRILVTAANELLRGSGWSFRSLDDEELRPMVIVSNDGRNRSRFEWVQVVRSTTRPKRSLPTIVELSDHDAPLTGRAMTDELELLHKADLDDRRGMPSRSTMAAIATGLRDILSLR